VCARGLQLLAVAGAAAHAVLSEQRFRVAASAGELGALDSRGSHSGSNAVASYLGLAVAFACCTALEANVAELSSGAVLDPNSGSLSDGIGHGSNGNSPKHHRIDSRWGSSPSSSSSSSPNNSRSFDREQPYYRQGRFSEDSGDGHQQGSIGSFDPETLSKSGDSSGCTGARPPGFGGSFDSRTLYSDFFLSGHHSHSLAAASAGSTSVPLAPLPTIPGSPTLGQGSASRKHVCALSDAVDSKMAAFALSDEEAAQLFQTRQEILRPCSPQHERSVPVPLDADFLGPLSPQGTLARSSSAVLRQRLTLLTVRSPVADPLDPFFSGGNNEKRALDFGDSPESH